MRTALSSLQAPGKGAPTAVPTKRVTNIRQAVVHRWTVDAASQQVGQGLRWGFVTINQIQQQLGHASLATTSRYLDHIAPQTLLETLRQRTWHDREAAEDSPKDTRERDALA